VQREVSRSVGVHGPMKQKHDRSCRKHSHCAPYAGVIVARESSRAAGTRVVNLDLAQDPDESNETAGLVTMPAPKCMDEKA